MDPWEIWLWPWTATRTLIDLGMKLDPKLMAAAPSGRLSEAGEEEWPSSNRVVLELEGMRLRDFSVAANSQRAVLVVAPFALHNSRIADLSSEHSLIEALHVNGCSRLFLTDWRSATAKTRLRTIDSYLCDLNVAVDDLGPPVDLIGMCQGGWLSLVYGARFPGKVRRLVLAGAPIDVTAEPSIFAVRAKITPESMIHDLIRRGDGVVLGRTLLDLWGCPQDESALALEALQLPNPPESERDRHVFESFLRWHEHTVDLPGPYYLEVVNWIFRENRIATDKFQALGRGVVLRELRCPLFLMAGERDTVAPMKQVLATATLTGARRCDVEMAIAPCNHLALFVGRDTLKTHWPRVSRWLLD